MPALAHAVVITTPLNYVTNATTFVGSVNFVEGDNGPVPEAGFAQHLLDMANNTTESFGTPSHSYRTHDVFDPSGTILGLGTKTEDGTFNVEAGWEYALAKYDGTSAGYLLFYLGGTATTLPQFPADIWTNGTNPASLSLSHYTVFNTTGSGQTGVPEGGSTIAFLGSALVILGGVSRLGSRSQKF
jgi:hypothetical protein